MQKCLNVHEPPSGFSISATAGISSNISPVEFNLDKILMHSFDKRLGDITTIWPSVF